MAESKMAKFKISEFKMAAIFINQIELVNESQSGVRVFLSESEEENQGVWIQDSSVWMPTWQNSRWLPSSSWVRMNEFEVFLQIVGVQWVPSLSEFQRKDN